MAGRMRSVLGATGRGWCFGAMLGLVLGAGLGTLLIPLVGTIFGTLIGVPLGAVVGLGATVLVAPVVLLPPSLVGDRIWPGLVATTLTILLAGEVAPGGFGLRAIFDGSTVVGFALLAGVLSAWFGPTVIRGVRVRFLRTLTAPAVAGIVGALVAAVQVLMVEGLGEPLMLSGFAFVGWLVGGILGFVMVAFNLLVTEEPAAE